ncbi:MAG: nucleotidyltransferase domain-containing protein [Patescibacteria group bacterium]
MTLTNSVLPQNLKLVILFGSQARGSAGTESDTDVAALSDHALSLAERSVLIKRLALELNAPEDKVDLVDLWAAPPLLQHHISEEGKLLYGKPFDFLRFRVLAWKRYQNTAKFRRARHETLKNYVTGNR